MFKVSFFIIFSILKISSTTPIRSSNVTYSTRSGKEIPSLVYLEIYSTDSDGDENRQFCGATPIDPHWILTSAACLTSKVDRVFVHPNSKGNKKIKLNSSKKISVDLKNIFIHEKFRVENFKNDIALIYVEEKLNVESFGLPPNIFKPTPVGTVTNMEVAKDEILLDLVSYQATNVEACMNPHMKFYEEKQLCMKSTLGALCENDIGNGLISEFNGKNYVFGVFSYGTDCHESEPTIFTKVSAYKKWIEEKMKKNIKNTTEKPITDFKPPKYDTTIFPAATTTLSINPKYETTIIFEPTTKFS